MPPAIRPDASSARSPRRRSRGQPAASSTCGSFSHGAIARASTRRAPRRGVSARRRRGRDAAPADRLYVSARRQARRHVVAVTKACSYSPMPARNAAARSSSSSESTSSSSSSGASPSSRTDDRILGHLQRKHGASAAGPATRKRRANARRASASDRPDAAQRLPPCARVRVPLRRASECRTLGHRRQRWRSRKARPGRSHLERFATVANRAWAYARPPQAAREPFPREHDVGAVSTRARIVDCEQLRVGVAPAQQGVLLLQRLAIGGQRTIVARIGLRQRAVEEAPGAGSARRRRDASRPARTSRPAASPGSPSSARRVR